MSNTVFQALNLALSQRVVGVFVPTTPNPTSGFLMLVPENKVTKLEMSVADGIKYIISLGAVAPEWSGLKPSQFQQPSAQNPPPPQP